MNYFCHNWNQLHKVLLARGWKQISTGDERQLYTNGTDYFVLQKDNELHHPHYVRKFCNSAGMSYEEFVREVSKKLAEVAIP